MLNTQGTPETVKNHESHCWHGALLYLGFFGARSEIGPLLQLAANDPLQSSETSNPAEYTGVSEVGLYRADANRHVYIALAAQVLRQALHDGRLDAAGTAAQDAIEVCAVEEAECMKGTAMHPSLRSGLQRQAVRGLGISVRPSGLVALHQVRVGLARFDYLVPYAVGDATRFQADIMNRWSQIRQDLPAP